ncbi:Calcium/calmodulin-dependent protein kinase type 1 [Phlyctochytrium planicorne]|nr:Calcium/calmodulin-dependent protein kinase type 1 [Phlyctochytrium planicorne]
MASWSERRYSESTPSPNSSVPNTPMALTAARAAGYSPAMMPQSYGKAKGPAISTASTRSIRSAKAPSMQAVYPTHSPEEEHADGSHLQDTVMLVAPEKMAPPVTEDDNNFDIISDDEDGSEGKAFGSLKRPEPISEKATEEAHVETKEAEITETKTALVEEKDALGSPSLSSSVSKLTVTSEASIVSKSEAVESTAQVPTVSEKTSWFSQFASKIKERFKKPKASTKQDDEAVERFAKEQESRFAKATEAEAAAKESMESMESTDAPLRRSLSRRRVSFLGSKKSEVVMYEKEKKRQYKFIKVLGAGAQGTVSLHLHLPTDSIIALKTIPTYIDTNVRVSFRREVEILHLTSVHPNIIRLLDAWEGKNTVYQVFTMCTGGDMSTGLPGPLPEEEGIRLLAPLIDAVRFLHELDILHRDVRPANIFLRRPLSGRESLQELMTIPVLADFGIATYSKFSGKLGTSLPQDCFPHIAPELFNNSRFTKAADCFGLATVAIQILFGRGITLADHNPNITPSDAAWPHLTPECKTLIRGLLERIPSKRLTAHEAINGNWMKYWGVQVVGPVGSADGNVEDPSRRKSLDESADASDAAETATIRPTDDDDVAKKDDLTVIPSDRILEQVETETSPETIVASVN